VGEGGEGRGGEARRRRGGEERRRGREKTGEGSGGTMMMI